MLCHTRPHCDIAVAPSNNNTCNRCNSPAGQADTSGLSDLQTHKQTCPPKHALQTVLLFKGVDAVHTPHYTLASRFAHAAARTSGCVLVEPCTGGNLTQQDRHSRPTRAKQQATPQQAPQDIYVKAPPHPELSVTASSVLVHGAWPSSQRKVVISRLITQSLLNQQHSYPYTRDTALQSHLLLTSHCPPQRTNQGQSPGTPAATTTQLQAIHNEAAAPSPPLVQCHVPRKNGTREGERPHTGSPHAQRQSLPWQYG